MAMICQYSFIILFFCFLVDSQVFHQPLMLDDEFMDIFEPNSNDDNHPSDVNLHQTLSSSDDDNHIIQQTANNNEKQKQSKMNFLVNFHLPRYLRHIN